MAREPLALAVEGVMLLEEQRKKVHLEALKQFEGAPGDHTDVVFTCDTCKQNDDCEFAFDAYNTNGDCLAEK